MQLKDRRRLERFALQAPVRIRWLRSKKETMPQSQEIEMDFFTRNVSSGGAFIRTDRPVAVGTDVAVCMVIPLDKFSAQAGSKTVQINVAGSVVRVEPEGIGIRFDDNYEIKPHKKA